MAYVVDPTVGWGVWEGWGTSLCWWANMFGTLAVANTFADVFFTLNMTALPTDATDGSTQLPGLGLNIARYNAGGSSTAPAGGEYMVASPNIPNFKQLEGFWLDWTSPDPTSASWDWSKDPGQRAMLQLAASRVGKDGVFELFSNSPMWWMCDDHNPSGAVNGNNDNLQDWNRENHALYLATIAKYASDEWGISFDSVEAFNEPSSAWWSSQGTQEGCHFNAATQANVSQSLRQSLDEIGLSRTDVSASDENTYDLALATWQSFDAQTRNSIGKVNVHGYQGSGGRRDLLYDAVRVKSQSSTRLWNSEYGDGDGSGLTMAANLILDFKWLHPTAWVYWQAMDQKGWGLIEADVGTADVKAVNPKYYVLVQFTRHIRCGMTIIDVNDDNAVSAYDAKNNVVVIVATGGANGRDTVYDLTRFKITAQPTDASRWYTETIDGGARYVHDRNATVGNGMVIVYLPKSAVVTIEITNISV